MKRDTIELAVILLCLGNIAGAAALFLIWRRLCALRSATISLFEHVNDVWVAIGDSAKVTQCILDREAEAIKRRIKGSTGGTPT